MFRTLDSVVRFVRFCTVQFSVTAALLALRSPVRRLRAQANYNAYSTQRLSPSCPSRPSWSQKLGLLCLIASLALLCPESLFAAPADQPAPSDAAHWQSVVEQSDSPGDQKAIACKYLAVYGDASAVEPLARLLPDPKLSSWARIALEAMPYDQAGAALRNAAQKLEGRELIGVIQSLGVRRDDEAVEVLKTHLEGDEVKAAAAAAVALGQIASPPALEALEASLTDDRQDVRDAVAEGLIVGAERLLANGNHGQARQYYDVVRQADVPATRVAEATRGAILARQADGLDLLLEQLQGTDERRFAMAVMTARELGGEKTAAALADQLSSLPAQRQAMVLYALADLGESGVLQQITTQLEADDVRVQLAAVRALALLGDEQAVDPLLGLAAGAEAAVAAAAEQALQELPGAAVDQALLDRLEKSDSKTRQTVLRLAGKRRIRATEQLASASRSEDAEVRSAALTALGAVVGPAELSILIDRVVDPEYAGDAAAAARALGDAASRMPDQDATAGAVLDAMEGEQRSTRVALLEVLGRIGGETALAGLKRAGLSGESDLEDVSTRVLGAWMNANAAPALLEIAQAAKEQKYRVRALRGYLRIARQFKLPVDQRIEMAKQAIEHAERTEEKLLALEVLSRSPSDESLQVLTTAAKDPALTEAANEAAQTVREKK